MLLFLADVMTMILVLGLLAFGECLRFMPVIVVFKQSSRVKEFTNLLFLILKRSRC